MNALLLPRAKKAGKSIDPDLAMDGGLRTLIKQCERNWRFLLANDRFGKALLDINQ